MIPDITQDHMSATHKVIWRNMQLLFPLESSIHFVDDKLLKKACIDYYNCFLETYVDMYNDPVKYFMYPEKIDVALRGRIWRKAIISAQWNKDRKTAKQLDEISNVHFLRQFFLMLGKMNIQLVNNQIIFSKKDFKIKPNMEELLKKTGFVFENIGIEYTITNYKYPLIFHAFLAWNNILKSQKTYGNRFTAAFVFCDFRALNPKYKCNFEDVLYPTKNDNTRLLLLKLNEYLCSIGSKPTCKLYNAVYEKRNVGKLLVINNNMEYLSEHKFSRPNILTIPIFDTNSEEYTEFQKRINGLPNANKIKRFCHKNINRCIACGCHKVHPSQLGKWINLFGRRVKVCGSSLGISTLNDDNFNIICDLIKIRDDILHGN